MKKILAHRILMKNCQSPTGRYALYLFYPDNGIPQRPELFWLRLSDNPRCSGKKIESGDVDAEKVLTGHLEWKKPYQRKKDNAPFHYFVIEE